MSQDERGHEDEERVKIIPVGAVEDTIRVGEREGNVFLHLLLFVHWRGSRLLDRRFRWM